MRSEVEGAVLEPRGHRGSGLLGVHPGDGDRVALELP
jgi:hypothetical protein